MEDIPFNFVEVKMEPPEQIIDQEATDNFVNLKREIEYDSNGEENVADYKDVIIKEEPWLETCNIEENSCGIKTERENEGNEIQEDTNKSRNECRRDYKKHVQSSSCDKQLRENRKGRKCDLDKITYDERQHKCDVCDKIFLHKTSLNKHVKTHTGEKLIHKLFECEFCGKRFARKYNLTSHLTLHKDQQRLFDKRFKSQDALDAHLEEHAIRTPFTCKLCATSFNRKFNYQQHMLAHKNEKLFKCHLCDKRFERQLYLNRHVLTHSDHGFSCDQCGKSFKRKWSLDTHLLMHTGEKPFKCSVCDKKFLHRSFLNKHVLTHPDYGFGCHLCDNRFEHKLELDRHMLVHSGEKPFKCSMCAKRFNQRSSRNRHLLMHIKEKQKCPS